MKDKDRVTEAAAATSIIHKTHASALAHSPQIGTQMDTHPSMSVAKPIGIVAKKSELVGSWIITCHISGYKVYRRTEVMKARVNNAILSRKKIIDK